MELDDLKETWRTATLDSSFNLKDTLQKRITAIESSGRGLRRTFLIEMAIVVVIYVAFIVLVWNMADKVQSYMYKLVAVTAIATVPVAWRMYKSQKWINSMDYTKDMRSNMVAFLQYYRLTVRLYQWSSYAIIVVVLLLTFMDESFIVQSSRVKFTFVIYMVAVFILTEPYIRIVYGRRISVFENFLKD
jgi:hypothetical protein